MPPTHSKRPSRRSSGVAGQPFHPDPTSARAWHPDRAASRARHRGSRASLHAEGCVPMLTVALWRMARDQQWRHGNITYPRAWETEYADPDGASWLFAQLDGRAESYLQYASEYFERPLATEAVTAGPQHRPLPPRPAPAVNPAPSPSPPTPRPKRHRRSA